MPDATPSPPTFFQRLKADCSAAFAWSHAHITLLIFAVGVVVGFVAGHNL